MDRRKATFLFLMTGRDESFDGPPPGMILHAHSIRYAIAHGFREYDFSQGNEPYKYSFGVKERLSDASLSPQRTGSISAASLTGELFPMP